MAAAASTTSVRVVVDGLAVNLGVRATAASTVAGAARRTVEYAAFLRLPQASSTGTTTRPIKFGRQKSRVCAAPASMISKERHRSTYAIMFEKRFLLQRRAEEVVLRTFQQSRQHRPRRPTKLCTAQERATIT